MSNVTECVRSDEPGYRFHQEILLTRSSNEGRKCQLSFVKSSCSISTVVRLCFLFTTSPFCVG